MQQVSEEEIKRASAMLKVLGEPIRFRIMLLLEEKTWLVNELVEALCLEQSLVSHHMQVLRAHKLVKGTREGKAVRYEPDDPHVYTVIRQVMEHVQEQRIEEILVYVFFRNTYICKLICLLMLYTMISTAVWLQSYYIGFLSVVGNRAFTIFVYSWPIQAVLELLILVVLKLNWYISYPVMFVGGLIGPLVLYQLYYKLIRPHMKHTGFLDGMIGVRS